MLCSTTTETSLMADQTTCCNLNSTLELIGLSFIVFLIPLVVFLYVRHLLLWDLPPAVPAHQRPKAGLDPSAIAALPSFAYRHASAADASSVVECPVCLSAVEEGETVRLLPACEHTFHVECIDLWLLSNATCPVCRAEAEPRKADVEEGRAAAAAASSSPLEACGGAASQGKRIGETSGSSSSSSLLFLRGEGIKDLENNL